MREGTAAPGDRRREIGLGGVVAGEEACGVGLPRVLRVEVQNGADEDPRGRELARGALRRSAGRAEDLAQVGGEPLEDRRDRRRVVWNLAAALSVGLRERSGELSSGLRDAWGRDAAALLRGLNVTPKQRGCCFRRRLDLRRATRGGGRDGGTRSRHAQHCQHEAERPEHSARV
jgi:hypothetical protein